ncbi:MAG: Glyoxalase family protein [Parcubacteria group bacterium GW2011_GWA1_42_7]|nr:MAG: Glyoxalase family protein [Parcubacteria group bacterium GW2011_GWB1_42_6]KKS70076.1 MAG: Glyoxalase family protein [Parcubacteria group bacterium GW2011_GWA1_42_7]KKS92539.1 MAG: Glyoxalase family protein [Parcubacteria group bacterium GW2011_GWC1_43_12]
MQASLDHISINVSSPEISFSFYRDLLCYLEYEIIKDEKDCLAARKKGTSDLWFKPTEGKHIFDGFHRKQTGMNHLAFHVSSKKEVDKFCDEFLEPRGIKTLYQTPKAFPEYETDYYAVYFEDPDRIKIEICFINSDRIM